MHRRHWRRSRNFALARAGPESTVVGFLNSASAVSFEDRLGRIRRVYTRLIASPGVADRRTGICALFGRVVPAQFFTP